MIRLLRVGIVVALAVLAASAVGVAQPGPKRGFMQPGARSHKALELRFDAALEADLLRDWMRHLASRPHHVGSPFGKDVADFVAARFSEWGHETAIEEFQVLFPSAG